MRYMLDIGYRHRGLYKTRALWYNNTMTVANSPPQPGRG
jgi:hypothetical protein